MTFPVRCARVLRHFVAFMLCIRHVGWGTFSSLLPAASQNGHALNYFSAAMAIKFSGAHANAKSHYGLEA